MTDFFARLVSTAAHLPFEVSAVLTRVGDADREVRVVLHLDAQEWAGGAAGVDALARLDQVSIRTEVAELRRGDRITVDTGTYEITAREPVNTDGYVTLWDMRRVP